MNKKCYRCKRELSVLDFRKNNRKKDGLTSSCKECLNELGKIRRDRRRENDITVTEKKCLKCVTKKTASEFGLNSDTKDGLDRYCISCRRESEIKHSQRILKRQNKGYKCPPKEKACSKCKINKLIQQFPKKAISPTGYGGVCRACKIVYMNNLRNQNPKHRARQRDGYLKNMYGITIEKYNEMYFNQNGQCAICKSETKLHIDHCHYTKVIRGLLCRNCNLGLGYFKDAPLNLQMAVNYLEINKQKSE